jgi:hypothetical protein
VLPTTNKGTQVRPEAFNPGVEMNVLNSSKAGFAIKTLFAGLLMLGLVACPEAPADLTPETFVVPPVTGAALGVDVSSAAFTVTGITAPVPISVIGGKYQIDSAAFTSTSGTVSAGQTVKVSVFSSNGFGTTKTASITVGGITAQFSVTTLAADTTPDAFSFAAVTGAALSTVSVSAPITVAGVNTDAPIQVTGGEYSIDSTTNFVSTAGTVKNAQVVRVRATSSNAFNTPVNVVLTIGGVTGTFTITTLAEDITPDPFSFTPVTGAEPNANGNSNTVTIAGINSSAAVTITGGQYSINGAALTNQAATITNGQTISVTGTASSSFSTTTEVNLSIGGVSTKFTITTRAEDQTPDAFSFPNVTNVSLGADTFSQKITVTGFETAPISVSAGGFYFINNDILPSSATTIKSGDTVLVGTVAPSSPATSKQVTLTIGTVSTTWTVTTKNSITVSATEAFPIDIANGSGTTDTGAQYGAASIVHFEVPNYPGLVLAKAALQVKITHQQRNDLEIVLVPPVGPFTTPQGNSSTIYFAIPQQAASNNMDATFDDDAPNAFIASCSAATTANSCTGLIKPFNLFSNLDIYNQIPTGQWQVRVRDGYSQASGGKIVSMSLQLTFKPSQK